MFQCSSASRKFLNVGAALVNDIVRHRFSALQRAENSSIVQSHQRQIETLRFSALQRAENSSIVAVDVDALLADCFSALQRAENSSIGSAVRQLLRVGKFQCSSASRKFLNRGPRVKIRALSKSFSALQRAENSSIKHPIARRTAFFRGFSALQRAENSSIDVMLNRRNKPMFEFQCSSASRKFLNFGRRCGHGCVCEFQCSSASRKFLNDTDAHCGTPITDRGFSALQRAENSSMVPAPRDRVCYYIGFSALQRAENSSIALRRLCQPLGFAFQCSSASRKFLNRCGRC